MQIDKSIGAMYRRLQKTLTSDELFPSLWDKCKVKALEPHILLGTFTLYWINVLEADLHYLLNSQKEFLDKYESFFQMVIRIYGTNEPIMSVAEMKDVLGSL
jgi:exocyst complex component 1